MDLIDKIIHSAWSYTILIAALYVLILCVLRVFLKKIIHVLSREKYFIPTQIGKSIYVPIFICLSGLMICSITEMISCNLDFYFPKDVLTHIIITISSGWLFYNVVDSIHDILSDRLNPSGELIGKRIVITQLDYLQRISHIVIFLLTGALLLLNFQGAKDIALTALASAGILTAIIGIAGQSSIANLMYGFQVAFSQPIRIGDTVVLENFVGVIEEINLSHVVIRNWDKVVLIIPISYFLQKPFKNMTHTTSDLIGCLFLAVNLHLDVEKIRVAYEKVLHSESLWNGKEKSVKITDQDNSSIKIRFSFSANTPGSLFDLECFLREKLLIFLQENFLEPFPVNSLTWRCCITI